MFLPHAIAACLAVLASLFVLDTSVMDTMLLYDADNAAAYEQQIDGAGFLTKQITRFGGARLS